MELYKTDEWDEEYGECIFFHFLSFSEPPFACSADCRDVTFDANYWTHFIRIDYNSIFKQAMAELEKPQSEERD